LTNTLQSTVTPPNAAKKRVAILGVILHAQLPRRIGLLSKE